MEYMYINIVQKRINEASIYILYYNLPKQQNYLKSSLHPDLTFTNGSGISDQLN